MDSPSHKPKRNLQNWTSALLHISIFFTTGFLAAFVPPNATISLLSNHFSIYYQLFYPFGKPAMPDTSQAILDNKLYFRSRKHDSNGLVIVITSTQSCDKFELAAITRLAHSLATVPPPLLWIVVEAQKKSKMTAERLHATKVMYRHLTYEDNFTSPGAEIDHQRNLALRHIELHRLAGIVHFANPSVIYDLKFFEEIRKIRRFGVWPVAIVGLNRRKVMVEGPICQESKIVGWFSKDVSSRRKSTTSTKINVFGLGFHSSILWGPSSSSLTKSTTNTTKEFTKFVFEEATGEEETKLKGIPSDCSQVMLWHLRIPSSFRHPFHAM